MGSTIQPTKNSKRIIFFDGFCHLCDGFVSYLLKTQNLNVENTYFSPLQGSTAKTLGLNLDTNALDSLVYFKNDFFYDKSDAIIEILYDSNWWYKWIKATKIFPKRFRDWCYDQVAKNRYAWFGKAESCRIPTEAEKMYFLN